LYNLSSIIIMLHLKSSVWRIVLGYDIFLLFSSGVSSLCVFYCYAFKRLNTYLTTTFFSMSVALNCGILRGKWYTTCLRPCLINRIKKLFSTPNWAQKIIIVICVNVLWTKISFLLSTFDIWVHDWIRIENMKNCKFLKGSGLKLEQILHYWDNFREGVERIFYGFYILFCLFQKNIFIFFL
jgi:hypothetical protein